MKHYLVTIEINNVITNRIIKAKNDKVALIKAKEELENDNGKNAYR